MNYRMYLAAAVLLFCIGIPELVLRGLSEGKTMGILVGLTFLLASGLCLFQARAEKRQADEQAEQQQAEELSRPDAPTEAPREPGQPQ